MLAPGTFTSWDQPVGLAGIEPGYRAVLEFATAKAGTDKSVSTGRGLVRGRGVAVVVNEFRFLAGTIGQVAARRIVAAVRRATAEGLPLLAATASGGTRTQEGTPTFPRRSASSGRESTRPSTANHSRWASRRRRTSPRTA